MSQQTEPRVTSPEMDIKEVEAQPTLNIRVTTTPDQLGTVMEQNLPEVWGYLQERGIHPAGPPYSRYHLYTPESVDVESGFPTTEPVSGEGRISTGELPGGRMAYAIHMGPYDTLSATYNALAVWMSDKGQEQAGPPWEIYWSDPGETPDPADWKTEVLWPVR